MRKRLVWWSLGIFCLVALWLALSVWQGDGAYRDGVRLSKAGKQREAVAAFDRAHFWQPFSPWVLTGRGIANRELKNYDLALRDFAAALKLAKATDLRVAAIYCGRGDTYYRLGRHAEAAQDYLSALKLTPKDARACNNLAWLLATSRNPKVRNGNGAIHYAVAANKLSNFKDPSHLDTLAAACAATGHFDAAARWENRAAKLVTNRVDQQIAMRRAKLYTQLQEKNQQM